VALLTGGSDKPYVFGLASELISKGATLDLIGSEELDAPQLRGKPALNFLKLRGDQDPGASFLRKAHRICAYYARLIRYAASAEPRIFHILWNNRFQFFDRTLLMLYYKALGRQVVMTTHNVNERKHDHSDTRWNRFTLRVQYRLADHIFVHTESMRTELINEFGVKAARVPTIPFGINNAVPHTSLTSHEARKRLGIREGEKTILFFGRITPYKGLEYLVTAFKQIVSREHDYRLIIAGRPEDGSEEYLCVAREASREHVQSKNIVLHSHFIPDDETEIYFKAADVLVLPYRAVYQSGVLFLAYSFGLPVIAADVGSLKDDIVEGRTGFVFRPEDSGDLAAAIEPYFASDLYADLARQRSVILEYAMHRHSWEVVAQETMNVYARLLQIPSSGILLRREAPGDSST
jgi:glycosyltransferase involved in cell wall biosynthesis